MWFPRNRAAIADSDFLPKFGVKFRGIAFPRSNDLLFSRPFAPSKWGLNWLSTEKYSKWPRPHAKSTRQITAAARPVPRPAKPSDESWASDPRCHVPGSVPTDGMTSEPRRDVPALFRSLECRRSTQSVATDGVKSWEINGGHQRVKDSLMQRFHSFPHINGLFDLPSTAAKTIVADVAAAVDERKKRLEYGQE